jgi:hypothetical protein
LKRGDMEADAIRRQVERLSSLFQIRRDPVLDVALSSGCQLIAPPYDVNWAVGNGSPLGRDNGRPFTSGCDGFSASGFGLFLKSERHVAVSLVPQGRFTGSWIRLDPGRDERQRSSGGTGVVIYADGSLLLSRQPKQWDISAPNQFECASFDLPFAATATPALPGSFGTIPLAPVLFEMLPGRRYLVWLYVWQLASGIDGKNFLAFNKGVIPLISVCTSDPINLHLH